MKLLAGTASVLVILTAAVPVVGQAPPEGGVILQVGVSYGMPLGDFKKTTGSLEDVPETGYATNGTGISVRGLFPVSERLKVYAEWYRPNFDADSDAMLAEMGLPPQTPLEFSYAITAFGVGGRLDLPVSFFLEPYLELGLARYRAELDQAFQGNSNVERSDAASGFNLGAGASYPLGSVSVNACVRYHTVRLVVEGVELDWQTNWLDIGLSVSVPLGG